MANYTEMRNISAEELELRATRTIKLWGQIDSQLTSKVMFQFNLLLTDSRTKPIIFDIDSPGGVVTADENILCGDNIINLIDTSPVPVYCIIRRAISMAYLIAAHCEKGHRYVIDFLGQKTNMHHMISGGCQGTMKQVMQQYEIMLETHKSHLRVLATDTGRTESEIEQLWFTTGDCYQTGAEMISFGAADKFYTKDTKLYDDDEKSEYEHISLA